MWNTVYHTGHTLFTTTINRGRVETDKPRISRVVELIEAIDGKLVAIECPKNTGSLYRNYKGFFSQVLLGVCDAKYKFIFIDVF